MMGAVQRARPQLGAGRWDLDRLAVPLLAVAMFASGVLLLHLTRGTTFWFDDWNFLMYRRGHSLHTYLAPYQGHLSIVPVAVYQIFFKVFGAGSYTPYRVLVVCLGLVVAGLVFVYARAHVGAVVALLLTMLMLFLGPGWQILMWPFQIAWLIVAAAGIGALLLVERRDRLSDLAACGLTLVAICSTSLGLAFAVGVLLDIGFARRRWRDLWVAGLPLVLYAIWALHYHPVPIMWSALTAVPVNLAQAGSAAMADLTGLSGDNSFIQGGMTATWEPPILVLALVFGVRRLWSDISISRAAAVLAIGVGFSVLVTVARTYAGSYVSRYEYVYCLVAVLLAAELARGIRLSPVVQAALCVATLAAVISNYSVMRNFGAYLRQQSADTEGSLAAVN